MIKSHEEQYINTLIGKYNALDTIFNLGFSKNPISYFIDKKIELNSKTYILKYPYVDEEMKSRKLIEINRIIESEEFRNNPILSTEKLKVINKNYDFQKFIKFGEIHCYLEDRLIVKIETNKYTKTFHYCENDSFDDLLKFLSNELNKEARDLITEKK
ncbi:hypothetical protein [Siminovitchia fordii]|uniref:Uncharacterized protein n=1 Tax=Siminovitchia fordii TaxID=254759 RepID=A0ABQ4KA50_9BACI|nr:hypothetical protein [Siminovitchia fordii]GIN22597.1 hypothetical protein J1TS3_37310 [Siminovitchia fordii]